MKKLINKIKRIILKLQFKYPIIRSNSKFVYTMNNRRYNRIVLNKQLKNYCKNLTGTVEHPK